MPPPPIPKKSDSGVKSLCRSCSFCLLSSSTLCRTCSGGVCSKLMHASFSRINAMIVSFLQKWLRTYLAGTSSRPTAACTWGPLPRAPFASPLLSLRSDAASRACHACHVSAARRPGQTAVVRAAFARRSAYLVQRWSRPTRAALPLIHRFWFLKRFSAEQYLIFKDVDSSFRVRLDSRLRSIVVPSVRL